MLKQIRQFFGIYTKDEKFANGYNAMLEAIKNKDCYLMRELYSLAIDNVFDFDDFDRGIIKAYEHFHNKRIVTNAYQ